MEKWCGNGEAGGKRGVQADLGDRAADIRNSDWRRDGWPVGVVPLRADSPANHSATRGHGERSQRQRMAQHDNRGTDADAVGPAGRCATIQNSIRATGIEVKGNGYLSTSLEARTLTLWAPLVAARPLKARHVAMEKTA
ncbi:hypothetical protein VNO78_06293 [Psophocarpus tetragonolobus]|uniref:Uncharacterized protein n=1 Tax=Psophocarpus tetragonolobus TaxID=3891 RepID=A0AAN9XRF7_PSOTE